MKKYKVLITKQANKRFKKIDKSDQQKIKAWIDHNLIDTMNPRLHGKALQGEYSGLWRYRVGKYRIIANIQDETITILIVDIGHRSRIYSK